MVLKPSKGKLRFNRQTNSYEPLVNPPLTGGAGTTTTVAPKPAQGPVATRGGRGTTVPTAPPKPVTKPVTKPVAARGGRGSKPQIDPTTAALAGWSNVASARPEGTGARAAVSDVATEEDAALQDLFDKLSGGGGDGGPTTAQKRAGGLQAARILQQAGRTGQQLYNQQGNALAQILSDIYNPVYAQQETAINAQQKAAMDFLASQYGGAQGAINQATQAALAGIPTSTAYQNVPIVNLEQEQNPLLSALGAYGAGTESVQAQSAADAQMAKQLSDLVKGSAGQLSAAQQAVLDAAKSDVTTGGSEALRQLALAQQAQQAGINAEQMRALNELRAGGAQTSADIAKAQQALMSQGIESLISGMSEGALQRAKTIAEYGPRPKKSKTDKGKNLPIGGKTGKNKGKK